jgi:WD40 repeat protein
MFCFILARVWSLESKWTDCLFLQSMSYILLNNLPAIWPNYNSKRLLAAAIYTKVHVYDIAGNSSTPVGFTFLCHLKTHENCLQRAIFEGHKGNVTSVSFHSEGKWVVTGSEDGTIRIWDLRTSNLHRVYENEVPSESPLLLDQCCNLRWVSK